MTIQNLWPGAAMLGEGPVWDDRRDMLWFVDIKQHRVHGFDPATRRTDTWDAPAQVGWVLPAANGVLLAGLQTGLARFDPADGKFALMTEVEPDLPGNRLNDATVGPDGCVWFGSMDDGEAARTGHVYRWDGQTVARTSIPAVVITNGPALSPAGDILYYVDTLGGTVHAVPLAADGATGTPRSFVTIDPAEGHPDGVTVDSAGNVWVGLWGGWCARRYCPDGTLQRTVDLPVANVTKIALGGAGLTTAFATTARIGLDQTGLAAQPQAGDLFAFSVDVPGQRLPPVRI